MSTTRDLDIEDVKDLLCKQGFELLEPRQDLPKNVEIQAKKDKTIFSFSVMALSVNKQDCYFGATNSTEWIELFREKGAGNEFMFIVYRRDFPKNDPDRMVIISPRDILKYSRIGSVKFNFNIKSADLSAKKYRGNSKLKESDIKGLIRNLTKIK